MPVVRRLRVSEPVVRTLRRTTVGLVGILTALAVLPAVPAAATPAAPGGPEVRLVVRTASRSDTKDVTATLRERGARPTGRIAALRAVSAVVPQSAAPRLTRLLLRRGDVTAVDLAHRRWLSAEPADARYVEQRPYLDAVHARTAWDRGARGAPDVRIAVVDSGADVTHPDLAAKVVGTFNAVTGGSNVADLVGHGTGVASVAAAATNNGEGIAGAGYDSSLLVAKVADLTGRIFTDDLAAGIVWAVNHGATVVNLSLGGPTSDQLERDAVRYAQQHGVLVVAAAGNAGTQVRQYPAALPGVLSVGATNAIGSSRAAFSSFGRWVDVAAPGRDILVAAPNRAYDRVDGTSFSAPLVSGQVALLAAFRPGRTAVELSKAVTAGANSARLGFARGLVDFDASLSLLPPASVPSLTAPTEGSTIGHVTTVSATTGAERVRFTLGDLSALAVPQGGVATASFPTYGLSGPQRVTAADCSRIEQCSASVSSVTSVVDNPPPTITAPGDGSDVSADFFTAEATGPGGAVQFRIDGRAVAVDAAPPYRRQLSSERLTDGAHTLAAVVCRADGSVCDPDGASVTVTTSRLHPRILGLSATRFSPGDDGRRDRTTVRYEVPSRQRVTLRVRSGSGKVVHVDRLGTQPAGRYATAWDGRTSSGHVVPGGRYRVEIATRDAARTGMASREVVIDRRRPAIRSVRREYATTYPVRDDYRDSVELTGQLTEAARWVRVEARGPGGTVVSAKVRRAAAGPVNVGWQARTAGGRPLAPGSYRVRLVAQDLAGNRATSAAVRVTVSGKRLVRRTGSTTVSAHDSLREVFTDGCSVIARLTRGPRKGWIGYYSSQLCSSEDAYAVGDHQVKLPKAARYGTVQLSAYGGRADPRYRDRARLVYHDRLENLSRHAFRLAPGEGTHLGPRVRATPLLIRGRVLRWSTMATGVAWYEVDRYTARYTYFVLR